MGDSYILEATGLTKQFRVDRDYAAFGELARPDLDGPAFDEGVQRLQVVALGAGHRVAEDLKVAGFAELQEREHHPPAGRTQRGHPLRLFLVNDVARAAQAVR